MSSEFPPPNPSSNEPSSGDLPPPPAWPPLPPPPPGGFDGGYPPPGGGYPPPGGAGAYGPRTNQKAIVSLVTGIAGIVCCGVAGIPAIIFGVMARKEIDRSGRMQTGSGLAMAGIILGVLALAWTAVAALLIATGAVSFTTS